MKDIAIYGAGGFGRETALLIKQINQASNAAWHIKGFFDDGLRQGDKIDGIKVLGGIDAAKDFAGSLVLAVADPKIREGLANQLLRTSGDFPALIHPSVQLGDARRNLFERGVIVTAGVILTTGIKLKDFAIINLSTTIGHDVTIGACSTIMPGCSISGNVNIGEGCLLGTGSRMLQNIHIGNNSIVGAGAVVTKSYPQNSKLVGVPAKEMKKES